MKVECPRCHTRVEKPLQGDPVCPTCGFGGPAPAGSPAGDPGRPTPGTGSSAGLSPPAESDRGGRGTTGAFGSLGTGEAPAPGTEGAAGSAGDVEGGTGGAAGYTGGTAAGTAGWSPPDGWSGVPAQPNQTLAIVALVLGIVGCCVFPFAGIAAIIVGAIALKRIKEDPQQHGGRGMALTGLILGIIAVVIGIIALIVVVSWYLPLVEFCADNPDDARCEGIDQSTAGVGPAAAPWHAALTVANAALVVPWLHGS